MYSAHEQSFSPFSEGEWIETRVGRVISRSHDGFSGFSPFSGGEWIEIFSFFFVIDIRITVFSFCIGERQLSE